jgi:hypothetical protein
MRAVLPARRRASSAAWSPLSFGANLWLYLNPDLQAVGGGVGATVAQLTDFSGNNRHITNTISVRPTLMADMLNGCKGFDFFGNLNSFENLGYSGSYLAWFAVIQAHRSSNGRVIAMSDIGGTDYNSISNWVCIFTTTNSPPSIQSYRAFTYNTGAAFTEDTFHIVAAVATPTTIELFLDGVSPMGPLTMSASGPFNSSLLNIGYGLGSSYNGKTGAIFANSGAITASDRQKAEGFLAHTYGLQANLPSDHPYKLNKP